MNQIPSWMVITAVIIVAFFIHLSLDRDKSNPSASGVETSIQSRAVKVTQADIAREMNSLKQERLQENRASEIKTKEVAYSNALEKWRKTSQGELVDDSATVNSDYLARVEEMQRQSNLQQEIIEMNLRDENNSWTNRPNFEAKKTKIPNKNVIIR